MVRLCLMVSFIACGRSASPAIAPPSTAPAQRGVVDLAAHLEPVRAQHGLPALAGAVVDGAGLRALGATGVRHLGTQDSVLPSHPWHLGSDTKAMTATLIAVLVQDGVIEWSTTVHDVWPDAHPGWADVTVLTLLQHRGGASSNLASQHTPLWLQLSGAREQADGHAARHIFADRLVALPTDHTPGDFHYSNAGYMLAGAMAEKRTGKHWQALMRAHVFDPLGMQGCGFGAPADPAPWGHASSLVGTSPLEPSPGADNPPGLGPAGTVHCPLEAWGRFVSAHLRSGGGERPILPKESWQRLHEPNGTYALGWGVGERSWARGVTWSHQGSNTFWVANVWVAPELDRAYLVVANTGSRAAFQGADQAIGVLRELDAAP